MFSHGRLEANLDNFAQSIFGMNLVDFDPQTRNLSVSKHMWLYFVISIPLTVVTLLCWRWRMRIYRQGYGIEDSMERGRRNSVSSESGIELV